MYTPLPSNSKARSDALNVYFKAIEANLKTGKATEYTHHPALKSLLEAYAADLRAINEPKRVACGAPDFVIAFQSGANRLTIGYIETKDIALDDIVKSNQLKRYLSSLDNLILTDYLEFRWYVDGHLRQQAVLAQKGKGNKLTPVKTGGDDLDSLLQNFLAQAPQPIGRPDDLASQMARLTHLIRDIIIQAFETGQESNLLVDLRRAFAQVLIPDMESPAKTTEFADMYAQTLAYGLFAARCNHKSAAPFQRLGAAAEIPKTNPLLRKLFNTITGPDLDDEPYAGFVDDLVQLLAYADLEAILSHFRVANGDDPIIHFYETFLTAYDAALREMRGVYYTPGSVVSYITRSVDMLLKSRFKLADGLADTTSVTYQPQRNGGTPRTCPKVLILDPAAGTGTFLYHVVNHIRQEYMRTGNTGLWTGFVHQHLLSRLFGFELLMAPYAVAHLKLGLQLAAQDLDPVYRLDWAYDFAGDEQLNVYLSNTLIEAEKKIETLFGSFRAISEEAKAAARVKEELPIMVILGNPPYSGHSANRSEEAKTINNGDSYITGWTINQNGQVVPEWETARRKLENKMQPTFIGKLVRDYYFVDGQLLQERNSKWLQDDYVKFIRWAQWRIDRTGSGILAFITNHGYLDNPTFRGMRQQLMKTFTDIYLLDLHGNSKKKEIAPDGGKDENVFDIQQGVAIGLFIKEPGKAGPAAVHHANLWGLRASKYKWLLEQDIQTTTWKEVKPVSPFYLFKPQDTDLRAEYEQGWKVTEAMPVNGWGIATRKDYLLVDFARDVLVNQFKAIRSLSASEAIAKYHIKESPHWNFAKAKSQLSEDVEDHVRAVLFRPFDVRFLYYERCMIERGDHRFELMSHLFEENLALITVRRSEIAGVPKHFYCTNHISVLHSTSAKEGNFVFPLYLYPASEGQQKRLHDDPSSWPPGENGRRPNFSQGFISALEQCLGWSFISESNNLNVTGFFGPEDVFYYIYAIFHSPTYRQRYAEFLRVDFPRVPLTADATLFQKLGQLGRELTLLHLLKSPFLSTLITKYPVKGDDTVAKGYPKYVPSTRRVYINKTQYFEGVPVPTWDFQVGGYQVAEKWLKDRQERQLSFDELMTYQKIVVALDKTITLMEVIDQTIPTWPIK